MAWTWGTHHVSRLEAGLLERLEAGAMVGEVGPDGRVQRWLALKRQSNAGREPQQALRWDHPVAR